MYLLKLKRTWPGQVSKQLNTLNKIWVTGRCSRKNTDSKKRKFIAPLLNSWHDFWQEFWQWIFLSQHEIKPARLLILLQQLGPCFRLHLGDKFFYHCTLVAVGQAHVIAVWNSHHKTGIAIKIRTIHIHFLIGFMQRHWIWNIGFWIAVAVS